MAKRRGTMAGKSDRKLKREKVKIFTRASLARAISWPTVKARIEVLGCSPVVVSPIRNVLER